MRANEPLWHLPAQPSPMQTTLDCSASDYGMVYIIETAASVDKDAHLVEAVLLLSLHIS